MPEPRPPEYYVLPGASVLVPARICALLERHAGLDEFRITQRGRDSELDRVLVGLHIAAVSWRSQLRTEPANESEPKARLIWVTARAAADQLHCTVRAVQKACASGRIRGELVGGRWQIRTEDLEHYQAALGAGVATRLDDDVTKPSRTDAGDGPADTTDLPEMASTRIPSPGPEALRVGTVNAVVSVPQPAPTPRDVERDRWEIYMGTAANGSALWVRRNVETGITKVISEDEALERQRRQLNAARPAGERQSA